MATEAGNITNTSHADLAPYPFSDRSKISVMVEVVAACLLIVIGGTGNGLVCYVIHRSRSTKSSMYYFMASLAYADLLVCCVSVPVTIISLQPEPLFPTMGNWVCKTIRFIQYSLPPASVAILTATALDRYFHICHPLRFVVTTRRTKRLALCCWGYAMLITFPVPLLLSSKPTLCHGNKECNFCSIKEAADNELAGSVYLIGRAVLSFMIPEAIIIYLYYKVVKTVWDRGPSSSNRVKVNIIKSLAMVVLAFSLSWAPFSLVTQYHIFKYPGQHAISTEELITFWLGLSASVYNPFIYAFYNRNFRDAFREVFLGKKPTLPGYSDASPSIPMRPRYLSMPDIRSVVPGASLEAPTQRRALSFSEASSSSTLANAAKTRITTNTELHALFRQKTPKKRATIAHPLRRCKEMESKTCSRRNSDPNGVQSCLTNSVEFDAVQNSRSATNGLQREPNEGLPLLVERKNTFQEFLKNNSSSDSRETRHRQEKKKTRDKGQPKIKLARKPRLRIELAPQKSKPEQGQKAASKGDSGDQLRMDLLQVPTRSDFAPKGRREMKVRANDKRNKSLQRSKNRSETQITFPNPASGLDSTAVNMGQIESAA